jgi:hypothetical protein
MRTAALILNGTFATILGLIIAVVCSPVGWLLSLIGFVLGFFVYFVFIGLVALLVLQIVGDLED